CARAASTWVTTAAITRSKSPPASTRFRCCRNWLRWACARSRSKAASAARPTWLRSQRSGAKRSTNAWPSPSTTRPEAPGWPRSIRWPRASSTRWVPTTRNGNDPCAASRLPTGGRTHRYEIVSRTPAVLLAAPDRVRLLRGDGRYSGGHRLPRRGHLFTPPRTAPVGLAGRGGIDVFGWQSCCAVHPGSAGIGLGRERDAEDRGEQRFRD